MNKRGQVTIFIILGIVIIVIIVLLLFLKGVILKSSSEQEIQETISLPPNIQVINEYIKNCLENQLEDLVYFISLQGGYFGVPEYPLEYNMERLNTSIYIPYYLYYSQKTWINKQGIEKEISSGINEALEDCINPSNFEYNITVDRKKINPITSIKDDSVDLNIILPIQVKIGKATTKIDKFNVNIKSNINKIYQTALKISDEQYKNEDKICINCLSDLVNKTQVKLEMSEIESEDSYIIIYTLQDLSDEKLIFNFAHKFKLEKEKE